ncbi:MAG: hypothetical protein PHW54_00715, partial [Candidatus Omnitrophica bacterium]|nr:hypothetical protein [Candidatus Omnitrophota bacterium]
MNKNIKIAVSVCLFLLCVKSGCFADEYTWQNISRENLDLNSVLVGRDNSKIIYAGTNNSIIKSEDGGMNWRNILSIRGQNHSVNFLLFDPRDKNSLFAATGNGLFYSFNQGKSWKRIFQGKNYLENEAKCVAVLSGVIYLGTKGGFFFSKDNGRNWSRQKGKLGNSDILSIDYNKSGQSCIYVACIDGVFMSQDQGESWDRIFVMHVSGENPDAEEKNQESEGLDMSLCVRYVSCDPGNLNCIYIATSNGVLRSCDRGQSWEAVTSYGLLSRDVKFLLFTSRANLYAISKSGIFEYTSDRWQEVSFGLASQDIRFLALDNQNNLYAACDKGLFKASIGNSGSNDTKDAVLAYYKEEPKINEVQQAAIKYAEVGFDKIKKWRKRANIKAILPRVTLGLDKGRNTNYEIYTSANTSYVYEGPDDKSSGWDLTLSWELGDLIWNSDQTSIDVRSRLMVELRDNILDEVTKLYFERIRVKMEINSLAIEDRRKRSEKEL